MAASQFDYARMVTAQNELEKMGGQEGDIIRILDYEFEYTK